MAKVRASEDAQTPPDVANGGISTKSAQRSDRRSRSRRWNISRTVSTQPPRPAAIRP